MLDTVDALLPLSLLEAVRNADTPSDQLDAEYVGELRNKRFGLSDTVYAQIKRLSEAAKRGQRTDQEETVALAKLIGRRPDAEEIFRAAGSYMAKEAYRTISPVTRQMMRLLPSAVARPLAYRHAQKIAVRYLGGNVRRVGGYLLFDVSQPITLGSAPGAIGCTYYEASLHGLLSLLIGGIGSVEHVQCEERGERNCQWRADWRSVERGDGVE